MLTLDNKKTIVALGYFDSVHKGHRTVMQTAKRIAQDNGCYFAVFTFGGNLKAALNTDSEKCIYTPFERERIIKETGADSIYFAPVTKEFLSLDKKEFLQLLNNKFDIAGYVSGIDYRFGKLGGGDVEFLKDYAKANNQSYSVVDTVNFAGEKISTTRIKRLLINGKIELANKLLGREYSVTGRVFEDRKVGQKIGFPTVNLKIDKDKFKIKFGVYKGSITIDDRTYNAVINYGARPTFGLDQTLVEAHIIGFNGDLYGREITLFFNAFMREVERFSSIEELKVQLKKDVDSVKGGMYD